MTHFFSRRLGGFSVITWGVLFVCLAAYLGFGVHHLGKFQTADEDLWFANLDTGRVHAYFDAWKRHDWEGTRINDKPGVTTALLSGSLGLQVDRTPLAKQTKLDGGPLRRYDVAMNERTSFFFRLPILIVNAFLILFLFYALSRYTKDERLALLATVFIFLSPILLGISQIVNPDATVWSFGFAALFAFLVFLRDGSYRMLGAAGIAAGFALLSKYSATFILIFAFVALFAEAFFHRERFQTPEALARYLKRAIIGYFLFLLGALLVFALFMPAVFLEPELIYKGTIGFKLAKNVLPLVLGLGLLTLAVFFDALLFRAKTSFLVLRGMGVSERFFLFLFCVLPALCLLVSLLNWSFGNFLDFSVKPFDLGRFKHTKITELGKVEIEFKVLPFTLTPAVLFFSLYALFLSGLESLKRHRVLLFLSGAFLVFFYAAVYYQDLLVHVRYGIFLYPLMAILAAVGLLHFLDLYWPGKRWAWPLGLGLVLIASLWSLAQSRPFYFNYMNALLPEDTLVTGAWGYGGYEAAQVLNALPGAENLVVWSDYDGFCPFFVGKCMRGSTVKKYQEGTYQGIDYFVMTRRGKMVQKNVWSKVEQHGLIDPNEPDWNLSILFRDANYVRIYKAREWVPLPQKLE